jgi:hypothetical protein
MVSMSDAVSVAAARPEPAAVPDLVGQAQAELAQAEAAGPKPPAGSWQRSVACVA